MMQNIKIIMWKAVAVMALIFVSFVHSGSALAGSGRGFEIAQEVQRRDAGYKDIVVQGLITNQSATGAKNVRTFKMTTTELLKDGDRRLVIVSAPESLRGMVFLTHPHADKADDTWLRLPDTPRIRRISSRNKTGRFLGSQFSLEDVSPWELGKYTYEYLGDTECQSGQCFIIQNTPTFVGSAYSQQIEWLDKKIYQPRRLTYYGLSGQAVKTLEFTDYIQLRGRYWRPMKVVMKNLQTGEISTIKWSNYQSNTGVKASDLMPQKLRRVVSR